MNNKIILTIMLFAMFFIGIQAAQPAAAVKKIDQFNNYYIGGGQNDDADVFKVYEYSTNHVYITDTGYNWNPKTHKYYKSDYRFFYDLKKISKTKLRISQPKMEGSKSYTYVYTKHSAAYYYWHKFRKGLKN
ncbi:MAG: hypothetical protein WAK14_06295 [Methanobacterium sp.]